MRSHEFFVELAKGTYIWGLFHDVPQETVTKIHTILRESVRAISEEAVKNLLEANNEAVAETRRQIMTAGKMALLEDSEDACSLFSLAYNACNGTDSADKIYRKLSKKSRAGGADKFTTNRADKTEYGMRISRFCFLCAALVWDYRRNNAH